MNEGMYKDRVKRLKEVDKVIKSLDPAIRAASFELLESYITSGDHTSSKTGGKGKGGEVTTSDELFTKHEHKKPHENAMLITAYLYSEYGSEPFSLEEIRKKAKDVGLTIPEKLTMTFKQCKNKGKALYTSTGRGKFKPTVNGEQYLRDTYSVSKGTKQKPSQDKE